MVLEEQLQLPGDGVRLVGTRWRPAGRAPRGVVLFLPGGGQTRHTWRGAATDCAEHGWDAVALDTRGHGDSDWAADEDYRLDALVADLRRAIRTLAARPVLVGASLGGMTSLLLEGECPGHARALVLIDVVPRLEPDGVARIQAFMNRHPRGFATLEEAADAVAAYTPGRPRPTSLDGLRKNLRWGRDGRWHWHWDPAFMAAGSGVGGDPVDSDRLERAAAGIRVPTLVVRGTSSDVVSQSGVDLLLDVLPHAEVADVRGVGHMVVGDDNATFTRELGRFLRTRVVSGPVER